MSGEMFPYAVYVLFLAHCYTLWSTFSARMYAKDQTALSAPPIASPASSAADVPQPCRHLNVWRPAPSLALCSGGARSTCSTSWASTSVRSTGPCASQRRAARRCCAITRCRRGWVVVRHGLSGVDPTRGPAGSTALRRPGPRPHRMRAACVRAPVQPSLVARHAPRCRQAWTLVCGS